MGVEEACLIPCEGGGGRGLPTMLGGRDESPEFCRLTAPELLEAPGGPEGGPLLGGGGGVLRGSPGAVPGVCQDFDPPELLLLFKLLLRFAIELETLLFLLLSVF